MERPYFRRNRGPTHVGQHYIADDQSDRSLVLLGHLDGMISATGLQDVVAVHSETLARHLPQRPSVFHQENCFCASWILASLFQASNQWRSFFIHSRQIDVEGRTGSWRARNPDISGSYSA